MNDWLKHTRHLAGVLFLLLWLTGCSHNIPRDALPSQVPTTIELVETPFYAQERYQCGPASLAMVLKQRGINVTPEQLVSKVYLPERQGSVAPEMVATARSYSMVVYEIPHTIDALLHEVAAGNPVLVLQNLGLSWMPKWHYAVVIGYDLKNQTILLRSGVTERYQSSLGLFDRTWRRGGRWGIVLLTPGELPATNNSVNYFKAAYALEQTKQFEPARLAYQSATEQWPNQTVGWLALANLDYQLGHFDKASETLQAALAVNPQSAQLWNNLSYTLAAQGCQESALNAINCAIQLAPDAKEFQQSQDEIKQMSIPSGTQCPILTCIPVMPSK